MTELQVQQLLVAMVGLLVFAGTLAYWARKRRVDRLFHERRIHTTARVVATDRMPDTGDRLLDNVREYQRWAVLEFVDNTGTVRQVKRSADEPIVGDDVEIVYDPRDWSHVSDPSFTRGNVGCLVVLLLGIPFLFIAVIMLLGLTGIIQPSE